MPWRKRTEVEFRPIVTGPSPQTPKEPGPDQARHQFRAFDPERAERKRNKRRAASNDVTDSVDVPRQGADAPAADLVAHQLGLQLLASPHLAFVQQLLAQGNADNTSVEPIVRALEKATAQGTHAQGGDGIEAPTAPEAELSSVPQESEVRSQVDLKKGPAIKQEDKEREPVTTLKKKHNGPKLPETNAEPVNSDMVFNPSTDVDVQHSSRRKSRTSITMADVQMTLRGTRRKTSIQRKRQMEYEDDGDDEEEETLHMPAKKENGPINVKNSSTEASIKTKEPKALNVQKNAGKATSSSILEQPLEEFKANPSTPALPTKSQPASTTLSSAKPSSRSVEALKKRKSKRSRLQ